MIPFRYRIQTRLTEFDRRLLNILVFLFIGILVLRTDCIVVGWISLAISAFLTLAVLPIIWTRIIALKQGLRIERILHDLAFFDPRHEYYLEYFYGDLFSIKYMKRLMPIYYLPHRSAKTSTWALLMPEIDSKVQYPNRWSLVVKQGEVSDDFRQTVGEIANDEIWKKSRTWLEIHSYPDRICVVWYENNWMIAGRLFGILSKLSEKTE